MDTPIGPKGGSLATDFLREALEEYREETEYRAKAGHVVKYIAPNGAPVLIEYLASGKFEIYGALEDSISIVEALNALRLYGSPDGQ